MIKAIIFDFYGVIRSDEYHDWLKRHGFPRDQIRAQAKQLDEGQLSIEDFFNSLSQLSGLDPKKIKQEFRSRSSLNEQLLSLVLRLKSKYKIALLSNASSTYLRDVLADAAIDKLFDEVVISSDIGYIKPSKEIFAYTLNKLGVKAAETIFIDDNERFVIAASELGLKALKYDGYNNLIKELRKLKVQL